MRKLTITTVVAITAIAAISAIASSMAGAAFPRYLPSNGGTFPVKFTGFGASGTLAIRGGGTISCTEQTSKGEILNDTNLTVTIDFNRCTAFSIINAHSLGDPANTILVTSSGLLCEISAGVAGIILTPTGRLHIEAAGVLSIVQGSVIGELTPASGLTLRFELKLRAREPGEQALLTCGGISTHLEASENEGALRGSSEATVGVIGILGTTGEIMT